MSQIPEAIQTSEKYELLELVKLNTAYYMDGKFLLKNIRFDQV